MRLLRFSLAVSACAALTAGLVEGALNSYGPLAALSAAGFSSWYVFPAGVVLIALMRVLLAPWIEGLQKLDLNSTEVRTSLAAYIVYGFVSQWALAMAAFNGSRISNWAIKSPDLAALVLMVVIVCAVAVLIFAAPMLSRQCARLLTFLPSELRHKAFSPTGLALMVAVGLILAAVGAWVVSFAPRIGEFDLSLLVYGPSYASAVLAFAFVSTKLHAKGRHFVFEMIALGMCAVLMGLAGYVRSQKPFLMLEVWGNVPAAGRAIEFAYDLESLRQDLDLKEIAPQRIAGRARDLSDAPDIVLITIDTLRADRMSLHGGPAKMPSLDKLAALGTTFERAYSPSNVTRRSMPSLATGLSSPRVKGRVRGWALRLDPRHVLVAERLQAGGYETAGFFCCRSQFAAEHRLGLDRGISAVLLERDGGILAQSALAYLNAKGLRKQKPKRAPVFIWLHLIEPHGWEGSPGSKNPKKRYDRVLEHVDKQLAPLFEYLAMPEFREHGLSIITSDHGEGLGDHGSRNHAKTLFDTEIRVPLVIAGARVSPQRLNAVVGLVDVAPTMMELAGFRSPGMPEMDGRSVEAFLRTGEGDAAQTGQAYAVMVMDRSVRKAQAAIVFGKHKLITREKGIDLLFDLEADPKERKNLIKSKTELASQMRRRLLDRQRIDRISPF